jgi:glutaredoxin
MTTRTPPDDLPADEFVAWAIRDKESPVVVFSLTWCSYCTAVKNLLTRLGIKYTVYDLDTPQFRDSGHYAVIRQTLAERARSTTLPEVFIGEELVGGYTETADAWSKGRLKPLLERHGVSSNITNQN